MPYTSDFDSIRQHRVPAWFDDAKLGIFIHWGLFSVPGWAPLSGDISQAIQAEGGKSWFENNAYAEWYLNSLKFPNGPTRRYHDATYGAGFAYDDFAPQFNAAAQAWNPDDWAAFFQKVGARYAVLTTKHHDGFTLWPTQTPCPRKPGYHASRDLVGELTDAVRARGLRMGLYYSGGLDWAFKEQPIIDLDDVWQTIVQEPEFVAYSVGHWRELIDRYQPSMMWNDIGFPASADLADLFAYYYNHVPDGLINDRFAQPTPTTNFGTAAAPHFDYVTPEYATFDHVNPQKWEATRGIGHSFGYNRLEGDDQLLSVPALVHMFVDLVSKNGNLLLNIGPMADGTIPANQRQRLEGLGAWLDINGEAIYATRPWTQADATTSDGTGVRFTSAGSTVYATLLGTPTSREVTILGLKATTDTTVQLLGHASALHWKQGDDGLTITLPDSLPDQPAHSLKLTSIEASPQ